MFQGMGGGHGSINPEYGRGNNSFANPFQNSQAPPNPYGRAGPSHNDFNYPQR